MAQAAWDPVVYNYCKDQVKDSRKQKVQEEATP